MTEPSAVIDTNVAVSFLLFHRSLPTLALHKLIETHRLIASHATLAELHEVLLRDKFDRISVSTRESFFRSYKATAELVEASIEIDVCIDPKDNKFLSLAVSGKASLILTGDDHLLRLHPFRNIQILKPRVYLESIGVVEPR